MTEGHERRKWERQTGDDRPEQRLERIRRRSFLRGAGGVGTVAGGALLAYTPPFIKVAHAGDGSLSPVHYCDELRGLASDLAGFPFSPEAQANLNAIAAIRAKWRQGGASSLTDGDLAAVWDRGWLPVAEINDDPELRRKANRVLGFPDKEWAPEPDNQGLYERPTATASRARLSHFEATCAGWNAVVSTADPVALLAILLVDEPNWVF